MKKIILIVAIILAVCTSAWAGNCRFDPDAATTAICDREYVSGVKICNDMHPDPLDYYNRSICIGNSQDVYNKCMGGCTSGIY